MSMERYKSLAIDFVSSVWSCRAEGIDDHECIRSAEDAIIEYIDGKLYDAGVSHEESERIESVVYWELSCISDEISIQVARSKSLCPVEIGTQSKFFMKVCDLIDDSLKA